MVRPELALVPGAVQPFGHYFGLNDEVTGEVFRLSLAAFLPPQAQHYLITLHDDLGAPSHPERFLATPIAGGHPARGYEGDNEGLTESHPRWRATSTSRAQNRDLWLRFWELFHAEVQRPSSPCESVCKEVASQISSST